MLPDDDTSTVDAFHRGRFHVVQPALKGHRSGVDAMILASMVPDGFNGRIADMGAGAGAAGLAVLSRCPEASATLIERSAFMAGFARRTLELAENAALAGRAEVLEADVMLTGRARAAAGLPDDSFGFVIMNPPFNAASDRATPDPLRAEAHVMAPGMFEGWLRTAGAILRPSGMVGIIARPGSLAEILEALRGRFGQIVIVPVQPRPQEAAIRILVRAVKGSRAPLALHPPLIIHHESGNGFTPRADAINNGLAGLF